MYLQAASRMGDNPHSLQQECPSHCLLDTHFPLPILDSVLLLSFEDTIETLLLKYNKNLGSLFLKISFCLSPWGRDGSMLLCSSSFLKTVCALSNPLSPILGD